MLNYSNTHRRDPHVKKYALKCALTLAAIIAVGFILFNYGESIWYGICVVFNGFCSGVATVFVATAQFLKPVFASVGQYMLWGILLVCLWSLCVFCKIDDNCEESKIQWRLIALTANSFLFLHTVLYMIYLSHNEDPFSKYYALYSGLYFYWMVSTVCLVFSFQDEDNSKQ